MSQIQTLPTQFSLLAGSTPTDVAGGVSIATENQAFASTLSALLADYLQAGDMAGELAQTTEFAPAVQGENLAELAFSVEVEGQGISALDGTALPPGVDLAGMVDGESAGLDLGSEQEDVAVLPTELVAVAAPMAQSMVDERLQKEGRADALSAALALKQDGRASEQKPQIPLGFDGDADHGRSEDSPSHELLRASGLFNAKTAEKVGLNLAAAVTSTVVKSALPASALSQVGEGANMIASLAPLTNLASGASGALPQAPAIPISPHQNGFDQELGERILWMTKNQLPAAEIRLNPAHLGPVEARVTVSNDQVSVVLMAHHSTTRDALEIALPRLREMFADSGLTLSEANVSGQSSQQQQQSSLGDQRPDRQAYEQSAASTVDNESHRGEAVVTRIDSSDQGGLDVFA